MTCLYVWLRQEVQTLLWKKCIKSYFKRILQKKDKFKKVKKSIIEFIYILLTFVHVNLEHSQKPFIYIK